MPGLTDRIEKDKSDADARTAPALIWRAFAAPQHTLARGATQSHCAICGAGAARVAASDLQTSTTSNQAEVFRYGAPHVCDACAWLFLAGRGKPGNFIAHGAAGEYLLISQDSVVTGKRTWMDVLPDLLRLDAACEVTGVLTTDVKPRLWHRCRIATIARFGLYVHAPEYDVSEWRDFNLQETIYCVRVICEALAVGFSKTSAFHGLLRDHARSAANIESAWAIEARLSPLRHTAAFLPALIMAGVSKEGKTDVKRAVARGDIKPIAASCGADDQAQPGLF